MGEGYAQAGGQDDVVIEGSWRRERGVVVAYGRHPAEHFGELGAEAGVDGELILAQRIQVGIDGGLLGQDARRTELAHILLAEVESGKAIGLGGREYLKRWRRGICGVEGCIVLMGPDQASEHVEGLLGGLAGVPAETPTCDGAEIEVLKRVSQEIAAHKNERSRIQIVVVTHAAACGVGAGGGHSVGVFAVEGVEVEGGLVGTRGADGRESGTERGGIRVSMSQGQRDISRDRPGVSPTGLQ